MRKFLRKFFWSHGTPLGYLGSLSQKGRPEIFSKWVLINLSNPLRHPEPLVDPLLTKNLDTAGPWCGLLLGLYSDSSTRKSLHLTSSQHLLSAVAAMFCHSKQDRQQRPIYLVTSTTYFALHFASSTCTP